MSSHLNAPVVRARQAEIAAAVAHAQHTHEAGVSNGRPGHMPVRRIRQGAALVVGLCLAVTGTGIATASAGALQHLSAGQLQYRLRALEAQGYTPVSCTVGGTRLYSERTNRFVTLKW